MKRKILVTGGLGYIGSHTVVELINNGFEVVIIDDLSNSYESVIDNIEKITGLRPKFYEFDLKNFRQCHGENAHLPIRLEYLADKKDGASNLTTDVFGSASSILATEQ